MAQAKKKEIEKIERAEPETSATIISLIEKVSENPEVPVETLERLYSLHERMEKERARRAYDAAFTEMQSEIPVIQKRGEITNKHGAVQSKYGKWEDISPAIKPILTKHGFSLRFEPKGIGEKVGVCGILSHNGGHREVSEPLPLPIDTTGSKNSIQGYGSSLSYGKRYVAQLMIDLVFEGEDDDGQKAGIKTVTEAERKTLETLIQKTETDINQFLAAADAPSLEDVRKKDFARLQALLAKKLERQGDKA